MSDADWDAESTLHVDRAPSGADTDGVIMPVVDFKTSVGDFAMLASTVPNNITCEAIKSCCASRASTSCRKHRASSSRT